MKGLFESGQRISVATCTPWPMIMTPQGNRIHEPMSPLWHRARMGLTIPTNFNMIELFADGMDVDDARNQTARACLDSSPNPDFLFFIDYDVIIPNDALTKLFYRAKCFPDHDVFAGVYCCKGIDPPDPLIYTENGAGAFWDWTVGDLLTTEQHGINAVHSGLTLIRTSLFQRMLNERICSECGGTGKVVCDIFCNCGTETHRDPDCPKCNNDGLIQECGDTCKECNGTGKLPPVVHGDGTDLDDEPFYKSCFETKQTAGAKFLAMSTEDIYFHNKAKQVGCKIMVDTSVLAGHHDKKTGITYGLPWGHGPASKAKWLKAPGKDVAEDQKEATEAGLKLALDIGAGGSRREWPEHVTYTTDLRADTKPDYVMDSRMFNLPDDHFDLTASSHHLEHLPRYEQERVWGEIFRVTKPGGMTEHVIPDIGWAAAHIRDGAVGPEVYDVLYGAQERLGFARDMNTHYFGYTKDVAKALAEQAGFVDVTVVNWLDDENLGFNLIVRGRKPSMVCPSCAGTGDLSAKGGEPTVCSRCNGTGRLGDEIPEPSLNGHTEEPEEKKQPVAVGAIDSLDLSYGGDIG